MPHTHHKNTEPKNAGRYVYGLDFGTSNTQIAVYDTVERKLVDFGLEGEPTILYYPYEEHLLTPCVGKAATARYIADGMNGRFFQAIKTVLPDASWTHTVVNGIKLPSVELLATIIGYFKEKADAAVGERVTRVVCGRPATYGKGTAAEALAIERMTSALYKAGFEEIHFQLEPIAAAFDYETTLKAPQTVLVGDFGGGTSDFTVIHLDPRKVGGKKRADDILATSGVAVAGNRFDSATMREKILPHFGSRATYKTHKGAQPLSASSYAHAALTEWDRIHHLKADAKIMDLTRSMIAFSSDPEAFKRMDTLIRKNLGWALFQKIEHGKIELSGAEKTTIVYEHPELVIKEKVTAKEFNDFTTDEVHEICTCCEKMLASHKIAAKDISAVFLTGGTAQLPVLRKYFEGIFGKGEVHTSDFFSSVARGLALSAADL